MARSWCLVLVMVFCNCTKTVNQCTQDSDCTTAVYPFCDVNGEYPAADGEHNVCTIVPANCPVDRCGCAAGAVTCTGDQLTTCNSDGKSQSLETCSLGCTSMGDRCATFKAANGLDGAMTAATGKPDVVMPAMITIDTTACTIHDKATSQVVAVDSIVVSQISAPSICAFYAGSFDIANADVTGNNALAFVATGPVTVHGTIDAAAKDRFQTFLNAGPGSVTVGGCVGLSGGLDGEIGRGGGNATNGSHGIKGASVPLSINGGLAEQNFEPLFGGCVGGGGTGGGGGGGAMQIDSGTKIALSSSTLIALGAAGGSLSGGGGSGGTLLFEAPVIEIAGSIFANGGGGGVGGTNCPISGSDATNNTTPAPGGIATCNTATGGSGGTATVAPSVGGAVFTDIGGGGSVGRALIRTADGTFTNNSTTLSIVVTMDSLVKR